ncbi:hypothetical protein B0I35DRAFT_424864 [Stachybotrys elegans]|uniref:Uncharacterized protein n=1 Tax=Stachybotrys elegans TaxID=80388 RepID=A0A8K0T167_9HYPO|nr:hypothetical protein B0I35DRAFT_424864 [Stachybotrys elegans]
MILMNSRGKSFCTLCGAEADGQRICLSCYMMKPTARLSRCECGEQRPKGRSTCDKCSVAIEMARRRGYRVDLATRLEKNPGDALRCFACDGPRAVGKRLCEQCFLAGDRVMQRERREDGICQDCGGPRPKHRQRCDNCFEAILKQVSPQDMRQEITPNMRQSDVGGKKRKREPGCHVPAQENSEGKQCGNPNCGIIVPPEGRLVNQRCGTCYTYTLSHLGADRPRGVCEKWKLRRSEGFADRTCLNPVCGMALPPGARAIGGRCRKCYRHFSAHKTEMQPHDDSDPKPSERTCLRLVALLFL